MLLPANRRVQYIVLAGIGLVGVALSVTVSLFVASDFFAVEKVWYSRGFLAAGLLSTGTIVGFLFINIRQTRHISQQAEEIWSANEHLRAEIAEHERAVLALRKSEARYRALFETSPDAITVFDLNSTIEAVNQRALEILGYERPEDIIGKNATDFVIPEERQRAKEGLMKRIEAGSITDAEFAMVRKDGSRVFVAGRASAIYDAKGNPEAIIGVSHDITKRKERQEKLRLSEEKYRTLFEESKDVVFISTPEGKFLDVNPAGVELFGYSSKDELLNININRDLYFNPEDGELYRQTLNEKGFVKDYAIDMKKSNGDKLNVLITSLAVRDKQDNIIAYRGMVRDMTEHNKLEEQLIQAQKMEAIGHLAGGVAHDFNNILTSIISNCYLLKKEIRKEDILRPYIDEILLSSERATNLTGSLLAFSRKQVMRLGVININDAVRNSLRILSRIIREDIELNESVSTDVLTVNVDVARIEQVILNLASNASDAMPDGGKLTISTGHAQIDDVFVRTYGFGKPGKYALISVADTGVGMDDYTKERIFEPFFTTKEAGKGTGLGLAMVYGTIKQHEGFIIADSGPGKGTVFNIYLPLFSSGTEYQRQGSFLQAPLIGGNETVLLAEDSDPVRKVLREMLDGFGYNVIEAIDGEDAVGKFKKSDSIIHLLVLDVIMPKMSGEAAYEEIEKINPGIKVLFMSGYSRSFIRTLGDREKELNFISKPISPKDFLRKIREILDK